MIVVRALQDRVSRRLKCYRASSATSSRSAPPDRWPPVAPQRQLHKRLYGRTKPGDPPQATHPLKTDRGDVAAPGFRARLDPFALGRAAPRDHEVLPEKVIAASK